MIKYMRLFRSIILVLAINLFVDAIFPYYALALTTGPTQPEVQGFQAIQNTDLVDPFTGDFKFNIPICEIGGYPLNLSYQPNSSVEDEASWVGLGWTLNPGSINRNLRGLPDDFKGDTVVKKFNMKPDETYGGTFGAGVEFFGFLGTSASSGLFYNNYKGWGIEVSFSPTIGLGSKNGDDNTSGINLGASFSYNSQGGFGFSPSIGFTSKQNKSKQTDISLSFGGYNSRSGLKELSWNLSSETKSSKMITNNDKNVQEVTSNGGLKSVGGGLSFGTTAITPSASIPLNNSAFTFNGTIGASWWGGHPNIRVSGYGTKQSLSKKSITSKAYGYMNSEDGVRDVNSLHDFTRDRPNIFYESVINVPPVEGLYDLFSVTSQNITGQFRVYRNDVGAYSDPLLQNKSISKSLGAEAGFGNAFHAGIDVQVANVSSTYKKWKSDNQVIDSLSFVSKFDRNTGNQNVFEAEPSYFRMVDELNPLDSSFYQDIVNDSVVSIALDKFHDQTIAERKFNKSANLQVVGSQVIDKLIYKKTRQARNKTIYSLNHSEASNYGLDKKIIAHHYNAFKLDSCNPSSIIYRTIHRESFPHHQFSEFTILNTDGSRNVFGIPVYNYIQKEVSFSVAESSPSDNVIQYDEGDDTPGNTKGIDNYFNEEILPPYATSYLLTGVLSSDYVDRTGDGISSDDIGNAVKFNYFMVDKYRWRSPVGLRMARLNKNNLTDVEDNKASYLYGEKDIWYMHSIESNTEIAQFYVSDRNDGLGVLNQQGAIDTSSYKKLKRLDSIRIYSRSDLIQDPENAVPIKTICFVYESNTSKQLCPGILNSMGSEGKLTLIGVYTKYLNNHTKFNYYQFVYNLSGDNGDYSYSINNSDRWGFYRNSSVTPNPLYFPYVYQDSAHANDAAKAFSIKKVILPSGGIIKAEYESDDYAYVQNKRAGQMLFIKGFLSASGSTISSSLYSTPIAPNKYIVVDLPQRVPVGNLDEIKKRYFEDIEQTYFNFYVDVIGNGKWEYINGYLDLDKNDIQAFETSGSDITSIKIPMQFGKTSKSTSINPVTRAVSQKLRLELSNLIFPPGPKGANLSQILKSMFGVINDIKVLLIGFEDNCLISGFGKNVDVENNKSWIRLANPTFKKYGGGSRVKSIELMDDWNNMVSNEAGSSYIQEYTYETTESINGVESTISSGVALWEPTLGGEENLFRTPLPYKQEILLAPDNRFYTETPIGEGLYPGPTIGYSTVKIRNKTGRADNSSNGFVIHKFYTAKDFPTISYRSTINMVPEKSGLLRSLFKLNSKKNFTVSQGFVVEVNNMHGKTKGMTSYNENGDIIAYTSYEYQTSIQQDGSKSLDNQVNSLNESGESKLINMGINFDIWQEFQETETITDTKGFALNTEGFFAPFFPIVIPVWIPLPQKAQVRLRIATTTKFISKLGVLNKIVKMQDGSKVTTTNLYYDNETGEPLITSSQNEFGNLIYNTHYPTHWTNAGMGQAYKNLGMEFVGVNTNSSGEITDSGIASKLNSGDEIEIADLVTILGKKVVKGIHPIRYYVLENNNLKYISRANGQSIGLQSNLYLKVIRSGKRNQMGIPIYQYSSLNNPVYNDLIDVSQEMKVLNASGAEFKDAWSINSLTRSKVSCVDTFITDKHDVFFTDTLIKALIQTDNYWSKQRSDGVTVYDIVSSVFGGVSPTKIWLNKPLNQLVFWRITDPVSYDQNKYDYYEAGINDESRLFIFYYNCSGLDYNQYSTNCQPFNIKKLTTSASASCANSSRYYRLKDTAKECYNLAFIRTLKCTPNNSCSDFVVGEELINPYYEGILGNWRPYRSYSYHASRYVADASNLITQLSSDGYLKNYNHLYTFNANSPRTLYLDASSSTWINSNKISKYDNRGNEVENFNAIDIPSSALFGYKSNRVTAVAENSKFNCIGTDGAEEWTFNTYCNDNQICYVDDHFDFYKSTSKRDSIEAHSGRYSIKLVNTDTLVKGELFKTYIDTGNVYAFSSGYFNFSRAGVLPKFEPDSGFYIFTAWVKKPYTASAQVEIRINNCLSGTGTAKTFTPTGPIIEGWQRIFDTLYVASNSPCSGSRRSYEIKLISSGGTVYFDDIRIHPFDANIKTYVYDDRRNRLSALLDENNYASFYEYDDAGNLIRVKKETERGIMTISEARSFQKTQK